MLKIERDLIVMFYKIRLVLILKGNSNMVKKAPVWPGDKFKRKPDDTKEVKKEDRVILVSCISC